MLVSVLSNDQGTYPQGKPHEVFALASCVVVGLAAGVTYYRIMKPQRPETKMIVGLFSGCITMATSTLLAYIACSALPPRTRALVMSYSADLITRAVIITAIAIGTSYYYSKINRTF